MEGGTIREKVWQRMIDEEVVLPDSRFHFDWTSCILDFRGSEDAVYQLAQHLVYKNAERLFITPDNCLEGLREISLQDGKQVLVATYGILRGFVLLDPGVIEPGDFRYVALLDGMEKIGRYVSLREMKSMGNVDLLVTGVSAVSSKSGVRYGKGHGFFDIEWALHWEIGVVDLETPVIAVCHDYQVIDEDLPPSILDTACDVIFTPEATIEVPHPSKPSRGIVWDLLDTEHQEIPPLQELRRMRGGSCL